MGVAMGIPNREGSQRHGLRDRSRSEVGIREMNLLKEWGPAILGILAVYLVLTVVLPIAMATKSPLMVVVSESMSPALDIGDIIIVQGRDDYGVHDIVVFKTEYSQKPIVHRIVEINEEGRFVTKGDSNEFSDPGRIAPGEGVALDDIQGKVIYVVPKLGLPKYILSRILSG